MSATPRRKIVPTLLAGSLLIGTGLLAGCTPSGSEPPTASGPAGSSDEVTLVKWGIYQVTGAAPAFAAMSEELGIAEKYGLEFETTWITDNAAGISLLVSGEVDTALTAYFPVIDANLQGVEISPIAEIATRVKDVFTFESLPDSGIDGLEDLPGKTVTVSSLNGASHNMIRYALIEEGIDPETVNFVELPYDQVASALERGTIDVGGNGGTTQLQMRETLNTQIVFDPGAGELEAFAESGLNVMKSFAESNPETVAKLQCAVSEGAQALLDDPEVYVQVVTEFTETSEEDVRNTVFPGFTPELRMDRMQQNAEVMLALGLIDEPFDMTEIVIPSPDDCGQYEVSR